VPVKIKASQTNKNEDILKEKAKSIPQYHHCPLAHFRREWKVLLGMGPFPEAQLK
jgi:hypothetical protein